MSRNNGRNNRKKNPHRRRAAEPIPKPARSQHRRRRADIRRDKRSIGENARVKAIHRASRDRAPPPIKASRPQKSHPPRETGNGNHPQPRNQQQHGKPREIRGNERIRVKPMPRGNQTVLKIIRRRRNRPRKNRRQPRPQPRQRRTQAINRKIPVIPVFHARREMRRLVKRRRVRPRCPPQ